MEVLLAKPIAQAQLVPANAREFVRDWKLEDLLAEFLSGLGDVDWSLVHGELYRAGFEGDCIIEHEDRRFEGTDEKVKQGFLIARDVLRPYCH